MNLHLSINILRIGMFGREINGYTNEDNLRS